MTTDCGCVLDTEAIRQVAQAYAKGGVGGRLVKETVPAMCAEIDRLRAGTVLDDREMLGLLADRRRAEADLDYHKQVDLVRRLRWLDCLNDICLGVQDLVGEVTSDEDGRYEGT